MKAKRSLLVSLTCLIALWNLFPLRSMDLLPRSVAESGRVQQDTDRGSVMRILVMGTDRSADLTDSMLIVALDPSVGEVRVVQIPRDTYAEYTERDCKKLNGASATLGDPELLRFLSDAMQIDLHAYVKLNLDVLEQLVDAIGGVDVEIPGGMFSPQAVNDLGLPVSEGCVHLNGTAAESFVRYRAGYATADLGRLNAQKLFLRAVAKKCHALSLSQVIRVACIALPQIRTDLAFSQIISILTVLKRCDPNGFPIATLPGQAVREPGGACYYSLNREGSARVLRTFLFPSTDFATDQFDPNGIFDRSENADFHAVYEARESEIPLLFSKT